MGLFGPPNVEKMEAKRDVKGLIKALGYQKDAGVRQAAARALVKIGAPAVEPLVAALRAKDSWVRGAAARALGEIGDARAVEPLIATFRDRDVRWAAAEALGKIGTLAVEPLIAALKDEGWNVRQAAAMALGKIGDVQAVEPLIAALGDKEEWVRKAAAEALDKLGWREVKFQRYPGTGLCDVCNREVGPGEAYLVPVDVFYSSKKYKEWLVHSPFWVVIQAAGGIEAYIAYTRAMDTTTHSAVCSKCIHLFLE